ncbi:hypothetical protein FSP39_009301 [Pinctada imbricata]|uniref:Methyltransferase type 11 domain-containing protein n=1 Tax=Pinctada imbricata TaxID=66713 RepID=A0AA88Y8B0_PINIB|nr:hypothetical protein FSP39_009301 [Pinctada imbricata]
MPVRDGCGIRGRHFEDGRDRGGRHLEDAHVYRVYNQIAPKFSSFSQKAWPNVRRFLKDLKPGSFVADIGCGSGRYLPINSKLTKIGIDICCPLVENARNKGHEVLVGDNLHIPFRDNVFDAVISIGVIHHFSSRSRRLAAIKELSRVLCVGGQIMIYVWAYEQKKRKFESQDVLIPWHCGKEDSNKSGQSTQSSYSDKDFSSSTSLASEDLSSLGSDGEGHPRLFRTISDPSSSTYTTGTLNDVNTYLRNLPQEEPKLSKRHRSNTLPSSLEGILSDEEHEDGNHGNGGGNLLARECRKLEASLRAMSSSEYFLGNGENEFDDSEGKLHIPCYDANRVSQVGEIEDHPRDEEGGVSLEDNVNRGSQRGNKEEEDEEEDEIFFVAEPELKSAEQSVDVICHTGIPSMPEVKETSHRPIHGGKNSECTKVDKLTLEVCHGKDVSPNNNYCAGKSGTTDEKPSSPKRKVSFFQNLKESFLRFIESSPNKKVRKSSKSKDVNSGTQFAKIYSGNVEISDIAVDFAVREFPQSSCPAHRVESVQSLVKSPETVLASLPSISPKSDTHKKFDRHENESEKEENSCVCNGAIKHLLGGKLCQNVGENGNHGNRDSSEICLSGINNYHGENVFDVEEFQCSSKDSHRQKSNKSKEIQGCRLEQQKSYPVYLNQSPLSEKNLLSLNSSQSCLPETTEKICSEKVLLNKGLPCDVNTAGKTDISNEESSKNSIFSNSRKISVSQQTVPFVNSNSKSDQTEVHSETKTAETLKESKEDLTNSELSRFYHVFKDGELSRMISKHVHCLHIVSSTYDHGNWCVVAEKIEV